MRGKLRAVPDFTDRPSATARDDLGISFVVLTWRLLLCCDVYSSTLWIQFVGDAVGSSWE